MPRQIIILDSAREEFKDIKKYVVKEFGSVTWNTINAEYKKTVRLIKTSPEINAPVDELKDLGILNVRYALVRQTRIVYEFDESLVLIHMLIHTRRDFRAHLFKRLFNQ